MPDKDNQDGSGHTGEIGADSNEPHSNQSVNVLITRDTEPQLKTFKMNPNQSCKSNIRSQYQVCGSMRFRMESSQLFKLAFFGFAILIGLGCLVCLRLNALENQIVRLQLELEAVKRLNQFPADSQEIVTPEENAAELLPEMDIELDFAASRSRRSVGNIPSQIVPTFPSNESSFQNDTSLELDSAEITNSTIMSNNTFRVSRHLKLGAGAGGANRRRADRERGKLIDPANAKLRQRLHKANSRRISDKEKREKLRSKLSASRNHTSNLVKIISQRNDIRASYLRPAGAHVSIDRAEQYIGPWHLAYDAKDIGFNGLWYDELSLDENGTSIVFNESGLYSIASQVYYHSTVQKERTMPMGYKIFVRKAAPTKFQRPFEVAQCVTAYPSTYFQTCYTAVTWYLEKRDEIFLKHFKNSFPIIEADEQGKTFLQIVKLG